MNTATFRIHGELAGFLPRARRGTDLVYRCARGATLKNAIEALGVPHTEVAALRVNGDAATLARIVREGDAVEVLPWSMHAVPQPPPAAGFVADAHLGGLARFLRMLGYDTLHHNGIDDDEIRRLAEAERRLVLSRDRELLKCREIASGCYVHAVKPEAQLAEVGARYALAAHARPFTLCLHCNVVLEPVAKEEIAANLPPRVTERHARFMRCAGCGRVYWPGSHYERMQRALARILPGAGAPGDQART